MKQSIQHKTEVARFGLDVGGRLRKLEKRFPNRSEAAATAGVAKSTFQNWVEGKSDPSFAGLTKFASAVDVSLDWLATGEGPMHPESPKGGASADFIGVPRYDARLAAGDGALNGRARLIDHIPFTREFLTRKLNRSSTDGLLMLEARGDSMEPMIGDGDLVLVDTLDKTLADTIMAFVADDFAYVKRLQLTDSGVDAISANPAVPVRRFSAQTFAEVQVIGRVRWIGRLI